MTLTLILTRHAKSDWDDPLLDDHDRPLNARGRRDAPRIGAWLKTRGYVPGSVATSSARRTQETWERIAPELGRVVRMTATPKLYHAGADALLTFVRSSTTPVRMLIAHNPGIGEFAHGIVATPPRHPRFSDYPTAATLVVTFDEQDWRDVEWRSGEVLGFATPHDLPE